MAFLCQKYLQWNSLSFNGFIELLLNLVKRCLKDRKDQFIKNLNNDLSNCSQATNFRKYKSKFRLETCYLELPGNLLQPIIDFRLCYNYLPNENNRFQCLDRNARRCLLYNSNEIGRWGMSFTIYSAAPFLEIPRRFIFQILHDKMQTVSIIKDLCVRVT